MNFSEKQLLGLIHLHFKIVIEYRIEGKRFRHFVTEKNVQKFVGKINANKAFLRVIRTKEYKCRVKIRNSFILDFYSK
jgi:hypothetical protein